MSLLSDGQRCKILGFSDTYGVDAGNGVARFLDDMRDLTQQRGLSWRLVAPSRRESLPGLDAIRAPAFAVPGYGKLAISMPLKHHRKRIDRWIKRHRPDCIHVSTPGPFGCLGVWLARRYKIPLAGIYHTDFPAFAESICTAQLTSFRAQAPSTLGPLTFNLLLPWYQELIGANPHLHRDLQTLHEIWNRNHAAFANQRSIEKFAGAIAKNLTIQFLRNFYASFDKVIARSTAQLASVHQTLNVAESQLECLTPGTDTDRFHPRHADRAIWSEFGLDPNAFVVLYVGRITAEKNIEFLLDSWQQMRAECARPMKLVMAGHANEDLRRRTEGIPDVHLIGLQHGNRLSKLYASADLVAFPSVTETLGQVGLEAGASGTPVMVSDLGGPKMYVQDGQTGYVLPTDEPTRWAKQILKLQADHQLVKRLGRQARCHIAEHYSIETSLANYWQIHQQTAETARNRRKTARLNSVHPVVQNNPSAASERPGVMFISDYHAGKRFANETQRKQKHAAIHAMLKLAVEQDLEVIFGGDFGDHGSRTNRLVADFASLRQIRRSIGLTGRPIFIRGNHDYGYSDQQLDQFIGGCQVLSNLAYHHSESGVTFTHGHILALAKTTELIQQAENADVLLNQLREDLLDEDLRPAVIAYDIANMVESGLASQGLHGLNNTWEGLYQTRAFVTEYLLKIASSSASTDEATWKMIAGLIGTHDNVEVAAQLGAACGGWACVFGHTHEPFAGYRRTSLQSNEPLGQAVGNSGSINRKRPTCVVARFPLLTVFQFDKKSQRLLLKEQSSLRKSDIEMHRKLQRASIETKASRFVGLNRTEVA